MNIYESLNRIMEEVPAIGKTEKNTSQNFKFRGIDTIMNNIQPLLAKNKVFVVPQVLESIREEKTTKNGGKMIDTILKIKYIFYAEDGTSIEAITQGEAMDSGDKSSNKAMAIAFKYALFQVFCIPTKEIEDPDKNSITIIEENTEEELTPQKIEEELDKKVTEEKAQNLKAVLTQKYSTVKIAQSLAKYNVNKFEDLTNRQYAEILHKMKGGK